MSASHTNREITELFIAEGKSALNAIDQVRSRKFQTVIAIQGKLPNALTQPEKKIYANEHCQKIFSTLGCGTRENCDPAKLPYNCIRLVADGDVDGLHSLSLLLALFHVYLNPLIQQGRVGTLTAPRYRVSNPNHAVSDTSTPESVRQSNPESVTYLWTEEQKRLHLCNNQYTDPGTMTFFKGVASLSRDELYHLLIDPVTRHETIVRPIHSENTHENRP